MRRRLDLAVLTSLGVGFAALVLSTQGVVRDDRLARHERLVMATAESVATSLKESGITVPPQGPVPGLEILLRDFSSNRVLVWLSRPGANPLIVRTPATERFLAQPALLASAGLNATGMQKPRLFSFGEDTFFTCSMPLPNGQGTLRFLEDVGIDPTVNRSNQLRLLLISVGLMLLAGLLLRTITSWGLAPLRNLKSEMDALVIRPSDTAGVQQQQALSLDHQPRELVPLLEAYNALIQRLLQAWDLQRTFVQAVSHELRSPLTLITGHTSRMLRQSDQLSPKQLQSVEVVSEEAKRLSQLLDDLLVLSRSDSGQLDARREEVQLEPLFRRLEDLLTDQPLGERLRLPRTDTVADLAVLGDDQRLTQCLLNLLENAGKYAPGDEPIDIDVQAANDHIDLLVRDRGPGILAADEKRVFERFQRGTGSSQVQGSGLGLSVVAMLMERIGGSIALVPTRDADGSKGRGSTFRLRLDRAPGFRASLE